MTEPNERAGLAAESIGSKVDEASAELPPRVETVQITPGFFRDYGLIGPQAVTGFLDVGYYGRLLDLTFVCAGAFVQPDGMLKNQALITSRSRMDIDCAIRLRDALDAAIKTLSAPTNEKAN